jgi:tRNA(fMet)-specific endonuclease VapC
MTTFMLDTNMVAHVLRNHPGVVARMEKCFPEDLCVSAVSEGEIRYGVAKHRNSAREAAIEAFLKYAQVLPWTRSAARVYARLRAEFESKGRPLAPLDMMIAAHAAEAGAVLITADRALLSAPGLATENWLAP